MPRELQYNIFDVLPQSNGPLSHFSNNLIQANSSLDSQYTEGIDLGNMVDSEVGGNMQSADFVTGSSGWKIWANGDVEFSDGTFRGSIVADSGTIGGFTIGATTISTTNFILDATGQRISLGSSNDIIILDADDATYRLWIGNATAASAPFRVEKDGSVIATDFTATGGSISSVAISSIPNSTATDISLLEYTHNLVFSVTDKDTVAWASGTITMSNGRTFSISSGNSGNMAARTYIYLDTGVSSTALQTTTTVATAMGANKILIAVAQNGSAQPQYTVFAGIGGIKLPAAGTSISNNNWSYSGTWSVTDSDTIAWGSGTLTTSDGGSYSISGGNTGNMSAKTYVYFDLGTSSTAFQTTTSAATAIGDGKILIAICVNGTTEARYIVVNDNQLNIDAANIVAGSITANEIAAGTITAAKLSVSQLSAIAADLGTITAGSINIGSGNASIDSSGNAVFKSIQIGGGTRQYSITNNGIFSFGDGSDGTGTLNGSSTVYGMVPSGNVYTMTRDIYANDLTISTGVTLKPDGYRLFVQGTLTLNGTAKIEGNGVAGNDGTDGGTGFGTNPGGTGGSALADGYLKGSLAGGNGGFGGEAEGSGQVGSNGVNTQNSLGSNGVNGGAGGNNGFSAGPPSPGAGGTGGTATASNVKLIANWHLSTLLDVSSSGSTVKFDNSASSAGGGGGAGGVDSGYTGGSNAKGGGGGGGGSSGRILAIYARVIVIGASASITANGGAGGAGGDGGSVNDASPNSLWAGGGGGGGGGGNGGVIVLVYNSLTNSGSISANGGAAGAAGAAGVHTGSGGGATGNPGTAGTAGAAGVIYQFQISL